MNNKPLPINELLRRAIDCAISDREDYIACYGDRLCQADAEMLAEEEDFVRQLRAYSARRWPKRRAVFDDAFPVSLAEIQAVARENS